MIRSVFLIIISVLFVIVTAWNFNAFNRLNDASKQYKDPNTFNYSCHFSKNYVKTSHWFYCCCHKKSSTFAKKF